mmetsp:Transcript_28706/g.32812  ORF Transcript_28706/g.32812 Transcript_28706/m.32812 type:complete len:89 (-) Transcript_28706:127-393(-)
MQHGVVLAKENALNASVLGPNLRTSLLGDNISRKSSMLRDSNPRRDSANLLANLTSEMLNKSHSKANLNREDTHALNSIINEEEQQLK